MNKKLILTFVVIVIVILAGTTIFVINKLTMANNEEKANIVDNSINSIVENIKDSTERIEDMKLYIKVNNRTLTATLNDNSSARELVNKLKNGPVTIDMEDYSRMEKVGSLGFSLPRNDESINTEAGDLILYQGNSFVIYYDNNNWSLTRLGKIDNISQKELKEILGTGNVKVTLSIKE